MEISLRCDPVFGSLVGQNSSSSSNATNKKPNKKKSAFAASASAKPCSVNNAAAGTCPRCNGSHFLNQCLAFRKKTVFERLDFLRSKELCENCFGKGHLSSDCTRSWVCRVPECGAKHNSWLPQQHMRNLLCLFFLSLHQILEVGRVCKCMPCSTLVQMEFLYSRAHSGAKPPFKPDKCFNEHNWKQQLYI